MPAPVPGDPLNLPTDLQILETLSDGKRQTPKNLSVILDRNNTYVSNRLRTLEKRGYVRNPGPADRSGMYEATRPGLIAAEHADKYIRAHHDTFHELVHRIASEQPSDGIVLTETERQVARKLWEFNAILIPSQLADMLQIDPEEAAARLYALYFYWLADRHEGMDAFSFSDEGADYFDVAPTVEDHELSGIAGKFFEN